jgi:predicted AAA+ superfamily ATPase
MIPRHPKISEYIQAGKVLVIYGPRRVGKTTLVTEYLKGVSMRYRLESGESISIQHLLSSGDFARLDEFVLWYDLIVIDEAQYVPDIWQWLKILIDRHPELTIIATGSSSFDLSNQIWEPLAGRKKTITLYPISQSELYDVYGPYDTKTKLDDILIYGAYPELLELESRWTKTEYLRELTESVLLKDILALENIKNSKTLLDLLKLLAFQIGSEVSHHELATTLGINTKTIGRYIDLLEKTFIIFTLTPYSHNLRNALSKKNKYYFYDLGIRNAIISQFQPLDTRNDIGWLWENFCTLERRKLLSYSRDYANTYFWRLYNGQEVDYVEEKDGILSGYEYKWKPMRSSSPPDWQEYYPESRFSTIHRDNYLDFVRLL